MHAEACLLTPTARDSSFIFILLQNSTQLNPTLRSSAGWVDMAVASKAACHSPALHSFRAHQPTREDGHIARE